LKEWAELKTVTVQRVIHMTRCIPQVSNNKEGKIMERRITFSLLGGGCIFLLLLVLVPACLVGLAITRTDISLFPERTEVAAAPTVNRPPRDVNNPPLQVTEAIPQTGEEGGPGAEENTQDPPPAQAGAPDSLTELYQQVNPGVVSIHAQVSQGGQVGEAAGSGFIIDDQGYIATNHHVVAGAGDVFVSFYNGIEAQVEVVGTDPDSDLAILRVESVPEGAHALPLADSEQVQVGQWVVAIGNPFNIGSSMSLGIVSAVGRVIPAVARDMGQGFSSFSIPKAIQTDAAINPGNSGGPLINMNGEVIGVNAQIQSTTGSNTGVGFAIPVNILKLVAPALIDQGTYQWPWLGITGTSLNPQIAEANNLPEQQGAVILEVVQGSPAANAGLRGAEQNLGGDGLIVPAGGDVIVEADGEPIESYEELLTIIAFKRPGDTLNLGILRDGGRIDVPVTLEPRPSGGDVP
jgi:2-alkenal reductase